MVAKPSREIEVQNSGAKLRIEVFPSPEKGIEADPEPGDGVPIFIVFPGHFETGSQLCARGATREYGLCRLHNRLTSMALSEK